MKLLPLEVQEIIFALCDPTSVWSLSRVSGSSTLSRSNLPPEQSSFSCRHRVSRGPNRFCYERTVGRDPRIVGPIVGRQSLQSVKGKTF
ncbi:hypothetical protein M427DRAFT_61841 [Gonapodya prolifera JEL478]|uniref:F-box domain-containing protein n=1 Tax=Gonapodya prolifera (strain JEL478) TaxID=1344416 RepID=A0A139A1K3_GONPJ|nr:hypothetical protein M427DRAFT_61841 [Gonapodya prolifera JEL478]|eukprot:KXS10621.1 hypothetical protein M427DRAFT_61841 [Gonapodya prolifera JEL478]